MRRHRRTLPALWQEAMQSELITVAGGHAKRAITLKAAGEILKPGLKTEAEMIEPHSGSEPTGDV